MRDTQDRRLSRSSVRHLRASLARSPARQAVVAPILTLIRANLVYKFAHVDT